MFIELEKVSFLLNKEYVLSDINVDIKENLCYGFTGRNGSGKTMLLRAAAGFIDTEGTVRYNGRIRKKGEFISNTGIIIGETDFIPFFSGYENLKALSQISGKADEKRIYEVLELTGLKDAANKKYRKYSLGMKQRLRIAQAILENPETLILDEPFNGLDKTGCQDITQILTDMKKQGTTILITSHNQNDIDNLCDIVYEMDNGKITKEVIYNDI